jgi:DNA-binding transcriptional regulator LsrR (DeoR family)
MCLKIAHLYFEGRKQKDIAEQLQLTPSAVSRYLAQARGFMEFSYTIPGDEPLEAKLIHRYGLIDAVVVEATSAPEHARSIVGQAAARYFLGNVTNGDGVAFSCGETLLEMVKAIPSRRSLSLELSQLSIEGDPKAIHQAPSTLIGLLRAKLSDESHAFGIQLPPTGTVVDDQLFRKRLLGSELMGTMHKQVCASRFIFIGVAPVEGGNVGASSFMAIADKRLQSAIELGIQDLGIVGEINNRLFDRDGRDCTDKIAGLSSYFLNVINLDQLRNLAKGGTQLVLVATGLSKALAIRVALSSGLANVVVTDREVANRLLE